MIDTPHIDWFALSTILVLLAASFVSLLGAVLVPEGRRRTFSAIVSKLGFLGGLVTSIWLYVDSAHGELVVSGAFYRDRWTALAQIILCAVGLAATLLSWEHIGRDDDHIAEFFALLLASAAGMAFFVGAGNLMVLFLALEWFSIALYVMCAIDYKQEGSLEAGLKYLIVGSFGSAALLFGSALVYGSTGTISLQGILAGGNPAHGASPDSLRVTGIALIIAGLGFKMSAAPFHMWTPDVYEGAPTPVTAWMSAATKVAALVLAMRVMVTAFPQDAHLWTVAFAAIAVASLAIGNFAALVQTNVKRILAYSAVAQAGFMLIGLSAGTELGARALIFYLIPYAAAAFGSFAIIAARERELGEPVTLDNLAGFGWERPFLGVAMFCFMFGFAGLPLGGGFVGKFYVFAAAYDHGWAWLVVVGVLATLVSLYYYLGVVRAMYMRGPAPALAVVGGSPPRDRFLHIAVGMALVVSVGSLFAVAPLMDLARHAASSLFPS